MKCYSCGKPFPEYTARLDGEARCEECAKVNRPWNHLYMDK